MNPAVSRVNPWSVVCGIVIKAARTECQRHRPPDPNVAAAPSGDDDDAMLGRETLTR
jgi:hypothetical protein